MPRPHRGPLEPRRASPRSSRQCTRCLCTLPTCGHGRHHNDVFMAATAFVWLADRLMPLSPQSWPGNLYTLERTPSTSGSFVGMSLVVRICKPPAVFKTMENDVTSKATNPAPRKTTRQSSGSLHCWSTSAGTTPLGNGGFCREQ